MKMPPGPTLDEGQGGGQDSHEQANPWEGRAVGSHLETGLTAGEGGQALLGRLVWG